MSIYIAGYILISILLLIVVNVMIRKQEKRKAKVEQSKSLVKMSKSGQANQTVEVEKVSEQKSPKSLDEKESIGQIAEIDVQQREMNDIDQAVNTEVLPDQENSKKQDKKKSISKATKAYEQFEHGRGKVIAAMMLGAFVAILNQTLLNVAIPPIMNDLSISASTVQWLSTGYMLTNGIFIPITAFLISKLGTRKLFIIAIFAFTVGSVVCSISPTFSTLMLGRVIQAAGAGIIMPLLMTVFLTIFPPNKRGFAMGMMGVAMLFAPAIGPTLSGWLIGHYSWRILFDIVIPVGVLDLILAYAWMKDVTEITDPKFDTYGFIFSTVGLGFLLYGFSEAGNDGWGNDIVIGSIIFGAIVLVAFIWRELTTEDPMLELRVFKYDIFALTTVIGMVINMAMFAAMILVPIYLQNIRGFTPLQSGLLMLPGALVMAVMMPVSGWLFDKIGARWLAVFGLTITVITTWQFTDLTMSTSYGHIVVLYVMRMFGMSFLSMTVMTEGMNQLPIRLVGHGTSASNTARTVAGSIGTAYLVTVMSTRTNFHAANFANVITSANPYLAQKLAEIGHGIAAVAGMPVQQGQGLATMLVYGESMKEATISGINDSFVVATIIAGVALVLSFFIKRAKPAED